MTKREAIDTGRGFLYLCTKPFGADNVRYYPGEEQPSTEGHR
jgi:hypothetical protein